MSGNPQALDIVKLNWFGNRASGFAPSELGAYEIFGEAVSSPCDGRVLAARDGLADNPPGKPDRQHRKGNHVVLDCAGTEVSMAHMKQGSITVQTGERVEVGQKLGTVGNSGLTLEPHLHIDAKTNGRDTVLSFGGRTLSVNSILVSRGSELGVQPSRSIGRRRSKAWSSLPSPHGRLHRGGCSGDPASASQATRSVPVERAPFAPTRRPFAASGSHASGCWIPTRGSDHSQPPGRIEASAAGPRHWDHRSGRS